MKDPFAKAYYRAFWILFVFCWLGLQNSFFVNHKRRLEERDYSPAIHFYADDSGKTGTELKQKIWVEGETFALVTSEFLGWMKFGFFLSLIPFGFAYLEKKRAQKKFCDS